MPSIEEGLKELGKIAIDMTTDFKEGAAATPRRLTVREFLGWHGYARRGRSVVGRIRNKLEDLHLRTVPDFEFAYIDSEISIELESEATEISSTEHTSDPTHRIGTLEAANRKPTSVDPNSDLKTATTIMQLHDFSQLPIIEGEYHLKGIISWKSIGVRLSLRSECKSVGDCMESAEEVSSNTPLFEAIGPIVEHGYVLVRGNNNIIAGIVTASDLSQQFLKLSGPFLLIGEIEGHLRRMVHRKFNVEEMRQAMSGSETNPNDIAGAANLTLGGYYQLLGKEVHWERLGLNIDRKEFIQHLDSVREIRNDVMHFDPDGLSEDDTKTLQDITRFFRDLRSVGAI